MTWHYVKLDFLRVDLRTAEMIYDSKSTAVIISAVKSNPKPKT